MGPPFRAAVCCLNIVIMEEGGLRALGPVRMVLEKTSPEGTGGVCSGGVPCATQVVWMRVCDGVAGVPSQGLVCGVPVAVVVGGGGVYVCGSGGVMIVVGGSPGLGKHRGVRTGE